MKTERRRTQRHPVRWDADVSSQNFGSLTLEIRDFCEDGLLLAATNRAQESALRHAFSVGGVVSIQFLDPLTAAPRRINARVVRNSQGGMGVAFKHPFPEVVTALTAVAEGAHAAARRELQAAARQGAQKGGGFDKRRRDTLKACRGLLSEYLAQRLSAFTEQAEDTLFERARLARDNVEQTAYFAGLTTIRAHKDRLVDGIIDRTLSQFDNLGSFRLPKQQTASDENSDLALVDNQVLEDWLARSEVIGKAEGQSLKRLRNLQRRLSYLSGSVIDDATNPLAPAAICNPLPTLLDALNLEHRATLTLYSVFGKTVLGRLDVFYETINTTLRDFGVLPDLEAERPEIRRQQTLSAARDLAGEGDAESSDGTESTAATEGGAGDNWGGAATRGTGLARPFASRLYRGVRNLLRLRQQSTAPAPTPETGNGPVSAATSDASQGPSPAYENREVLDVVSRLQQTATELAASGIPPSSLRERLLSELNGHGTPEKSLSAQQVESIEVLDDWFEDLRQSASNTPFFRHWSDPLSLLALRVQMQDGGFLGDDEHPVHEFINEVDRADSALAASQGRDRESLEQTLNPLVEQIISEYSGDPASLQDGTRKIAKLIQRPLRVRETNEEKVRQGCEGAQRLEQAKRAVSAAMDKRMAGRRVPRAILNLLELGWYNLLVIVQLREGNDSKAWREAVDVIDQLLSGLGTAESPPHPLKNPKALLQSVEERLTAICRFPSRLHDLLGQLEDYLVPPAGGGTPKRAPLVAVPPAREKDADVPGLPQQWVGQAKLMKVGEWVSFKAWDEQPEPLRLAWRSDDDTRFVFVNRSGHKARELSIEELAQELGSQTAEVIDDLDQPMTERRWQDMLVKLNNELVHQTNHDPLTTLLNRNALQHRLRHLLDRPATEQSNHVLCLFALDGFKVVNSTLGHAGGDQLLKEIAQHLSTAAAKRGLGVVARIGGDEFGVLLVECSPEEGAAFAEKQRHMIRQNRFEIDNERVSIAVSAGVVPFSRQTHTLNTLLKDADDACFAAKNAGGNRIHVYHAGDEELAGLRTSMEHATLVDRALASGRLELRCQRIVPLDPTREPRPMYELLISLAGNDLIKPNDFIPAAERFGRMPAVDRWVIREAFNWCNRNKDRLDHVDALSINLSGQTLNDVGFMEFLRDQLASTAVPSTKICFEVTETAAVANLSTAADLIRELKKTGCRFALDDFGSGLSSYSYLKNLPADYLKIDGEFIRDLDKDNADYALVSSINELSHYLGKYTIAEYVESDRILGHLKEIGLDFAQGYGIEPPIPIDRLALEPARTLH